MTDTSIFFHYYFDHSLQDFKVLTDIDKEPIVTSGDILIFIKTKQKFHKLLICKLSELKRTLKSSWSNNSFT